MKGNKIAASVLSAAICVSSSLPVSALADNSVNVKYETKNVNLVNAENTETTTKAVTTTTAKATSTTTTAKATTTTSKAAATTAKATTTTKAAATTAKATTTTAKAETTAVKTETTTAKPTTTTAAATTTTTAATTVVTTTAPPTYDLGDPTGDGIIDATDASFILTDYANTSVDKESEMNEQQKLVSDVNRDGVVDASDASVVLTYYSYTSVNGNIDFRDYLTKPAETTTTTAPATTTTTTTTSATTTTTAETTTAVTTTTADIYTVSSITVTPSSVEIGVGGVQTVYAKFFPATASDKSERWETSDNSIAVVDKYGKITGIAPGKCKITVISVSNPEISADVEVTVKGNGSVSPTDTAESIKLTKSELNLAVGASEKVYATVLPSTADGSVRWESSDPSAVKVDQYGTVTALKPGKCVITVFSTQNQKITAELTVNVKEKEVSPDDIYTVQAIELSKTEMTLNVGQRDLSYVTIVPQTATDWGEIWSTSDPNIATVDHEGYVTAVAPGTCTVTVTSRQNPKVSKDIAVTVKGSSSNTAPDPNDIYTVQAIELSKTEMTLNVGQRDLSYVTIVPQTATDWGEIWSTSDPNIATVDHEGYVTAVAPGTCTVTVTSRQNPKVSKDIAVTVKGSSSNTAPDPNDIYTVQAIELSKTEMSLNVGQRDLSYVTIVPQTATDWGEIWSTSDPNIATVDREGYVTAVAPGVCFVTVTSRQNPNVSRNIVVTVKENSSSETAVQSIQLSKYDINLGVGGKAISIVTMLPTTANDQSELWTTSNPNVATVDEQGWITGINPGSCIVTVQSRSNPKVFAEIRVTVVGSSQTGGQTSENTRVTGISLSKNAMSLSVGGTDISYVTMTPANAANKEEIWISSNPNVATVDKYGYVTGVSEGNCVITVRSEDNPNVKATVTVVVSGANAYSSDNNAVMEIKLSKTYMGLNIGEKDISYVTMLPENATDKGEVWSTSDPNVAVVDNLGWVTAKGPGSCMITVRSKSNPGVYKMISVMVPPTPYKAPKTPDVTTENGVTYVDGILIANKTYALPSTYNPGGLLPEVMAQFSKLAAAAKKDGLNIYISSGFRSYLTQQSIYNNNVYYYGTAKTDTFSARPGHSEHQTGLAMDVNTISDAFIGTPEAIWLAEHAQEYGFIIRYPKGKENITGYKYEPWHLRYLGVETAEDVYMSGLCLEEYLGIDSAYRS